jgi:hypothetical protein
MKNKSVPENYKVGEAISGKKAVVPSKNGKEESGIVVYRRKAEYREDPFKKRA